MVNKEHLENFYNTKILPSLEPLERERKKVLFKQRISILLFLIIWGYIAYVLLTYTKLEIGHIIGQSAFVFVAYLFLDSYITFEFKSKYKSNVIKPLIEQLGEKLEYSPNKKIKEQKFIDSNLFYYWTKYYGDDYVTGEIQGVEIEFSELNVIRSTKHVEMDIFTGLFIICEFNKNVRHDVRVVPNQYEFSLGALTKLFGIDGAEKLDNIEFNNIFTVYGEDAVTTRYILTHTMMENLLSFQENMNVPVCASFQGSKFYLALDFNNRQLFEPSISRPLKDNADIKFFAELLVGISQIINDFKLNEYLWSKEKRETRDRVINL